MSEINYVPRPGIILSKICGRMFLVPTRKAAEKGHLNIMPLTLLGTVIWTAVERKESIDVLYRAIAALKKQSVDEVKGEVDSYLLSMSEKGFLIKEEKADE